MSVKIKLDITKESSGSVDIYTLNVEGKFQCVGDSLKYVLESLEDYEQTFDEGLFEAA